MNEKPPSCPEGQSDAAVELWDDIAGRFTLDHAERVLLTEAVRTVTDLDQLAAVVAREGVMLDGKPHPALVEGRQLRQVLARLVASLRLPEDGDQRPQRRGGARVPYGLAGAR